jgi:hypothetical protein
MGGPAEVARAFPPAPPDSRPVVTVPTGALTTLAPPLMTPAEDGDDETPPLTTSEQATMPVPTSSITGPIPTSPTTTVAISPASDTSSALGTVTIVVVLVVPAAVLLATMIVRRRGASSAQKPAHLASPEPAPAPPPALPAPREIVEFANRTVLVLMERGSRP